MIMMVKILIGFGGDDDGDVDDDGLGVPDCPAMSSVSLYVN